MKNELLQQFFSQKHASVAVIIAIFNVDISYADLPLSIEELLADQQETRLEFGMTYANTDRKRSDAKFNLVGVGPSSYLLLPVDIEETRQNSDTVIFTFGARYGLSADTELYMRTSANADSVRTYSASGSSTRSSQQWRDLALGVNHQLSPDSKTAALLGFAEVTAVENTAFDGNEFVYLKTAQLGLTTYRSIDPIVLSLTGGTRIAASRKSKSGRVNPGDLLFIHPGVSFAVNNEITLTGGARFKFRSKDKVEGRPSSPRTSQTDLEFGLAFSSTDATTLNFRVIADATSDNGVQASLTLIQKLTK